MSKQKVIDEFNTLIDKVTEPNAKGINETLIKRIIYLIDEGNIKSSDAFQAIHFKIVDNNPGTAINGLKVLEIVFNNCGTIIYREVATTAYMQCLKDIIKNTEHQYIRNFILKLIEDWVQVLKYFSAYKAPKKLLKELQLEGYVFPNSDDLNSTQPELSDTQKPKPVTMNIVENNNIYDVGDTSQDNCTANFENREEEFKKQLREIQRAKKKQYKEFRKAAGLPTTSDEEDNDKNLHSANDNKGNLDSYKKIQSQLREKCLVLRPPSNEDHQTQNFEPKKQIPKEMMKVKESRRESKKSTQEYRERRQQAYYDEKPNLRENSNGVLHKCEKNCTECKKYKKPVENENVPPPKRWPPEIRKIKESKRAMKNSIEEYKKSKKDTYYNEKEGLRPLPNMSEDKNSVTEEDDDEDLKKALVLSELENNPRSNNDLNKPQLLGDLQEQRDLDLALELSLQEDNASCNNLSTDFQSLSIYEPNSESPSLDWPMCIMCDAKNVFLKRFKPCNHKCICTSCADVYSEKKCPVCFMEFRAMI